MAEISIWKAIKACIIILLIVVVLKKVLQVWRQHKKEMKIIDDEAYAKRLQDEKLANAQMHRDNFAAITNPVTGMAQAALAPPVYGNPGMYGGADEDIPDPEKIEYNIDSEDSDDDDDSDDYSDNDDYGEDTDDSSVVEKSMEGGSFFDILSKVKKAALKKKKAVKKASAKKTSSKKKSTKKTSSKNKSTKKTSTKKKGKK